MEMIIQYITANWVSWLLGLISVVLSRAYHKLAKQLKTERARTNAINAGVLHFSMIGFIRLVRFI